MSNDEVTVHCMIRNELFWIEPVLLAALACTRNIIVMDTGSEDGTKDVIEKLWKPGVRIEYSDHILDAEENGRARQILSDMTKTEWAFMLDGDELYEVSKLKYLLANPPPSNYKLGFTTLLNVDWKDGHFVARNKHNSQKYFRPKENIWKGNYPFEVPDQYEDPKGYFYYQLPPGEVHGVHLHCLKRSPLDDQMQMRMVQKEANSRCPITQDPYDDFPWPPEYLFPDWHPYIPSSTLVSSISGSPDY